MDWTSIRPLIKEYVYLLALPVTFDIINVMIELKISLLLYPVARYTYQR